MGVGHLLPERPLGGHKINLFFSVFIYFGVLVFWGVFDSFFLDSSRFSPSVALIFVENYCFWTIFGPFYFFIT